ncbi:hypothetical protein BaRGS_00035181 [Batillaria attramentaria]|uniref:Uncharacterized protein n=1 Tax=Batillaria attramentaria TaxID=370345 RepID=A0ABD0JFG3_9CAEN
METDLKLRLPSAWPLGLNSPACAGVGAAIAAGNVFRQQMKASLLCCTIYSPLPIIHTGSWYPEADQLTPSQSFTGGWVTFGEPEIAEAEPEIEANSGLAPHPRVDTGVLLGVCWGDPIVMTDSGWKVAWVGL